MPTAYVKVEFGSLCGTQNGESPARPSIIFPVIPGLRVQGFGFGIWGFRVSTSPKSTQPLSEQNSGLQVQGFGFEVQNSGLTDEAQRRNGQK